jgi:hypothetical protein
MKSVGTLLCACLTATGCAGLTRPAAPGDALSRVNSATVPPSKNHLPRAVPRTQGDITANPVDAPDAAIVSDIKPVAYHQPPFSRVARASAYHKAPAKTPPEELIAPEPTAAPGTGELGQDRATRRLTDVPLDIRPPAGTMPSDVAQEALAALPDSGVEQRGCRRPAIFCSCTPWTVCYRPLYFEDIDLERYGCACGILQPAVSEAKFIGTVATLPYKMVVRPPRSCQCSNGFSRCGDCPPPGYGACVFSLPAAAVEAGIVAGIVVALP